MRDVERPHVSTSTPLLGRGPEKTSGSFLEYRVTFENLTMITPMFNRSIHTGYRDWEYGDIEVYAIGFERNGDA